MPNSNPPFEVRVDRTTKLRVLSLTGDRIVVDTVPDPHDFHPTPLRIYEREFEKLKTGIPTLKKHLMDKKTVKIPLNESRKVYAGVVVEKGTGAFMIEIARYWRPDDYESDTRTRSYILISAGSLKTFETGVTKVANKIEALKATPEE